MNQLYAYIGQVGALIPWELINTTNQGGLLFVFCSPLNSSFTSIPLGTTCYPSSSVG